MKNAGKKELALGLFVKSEMNRKEIAATVGISEKTLRSWIDAGEWEKQRESLRITRPQLLQEAYAQLKAINDIIRDKHNGVPSKDLSDAKAVIRKEIEALEKSPIFRYVEVFEDYMNWLSKGYPLEMIAFAKRSQEFISDLQKER